MKNEESDRKNATEIIADFCRMYQRAGKEGRAEALWGDASMEKAVEAVRKSVLRSSQKPGFYLEFPFTGKPRMDMLLQYTCQSIEVPAEFYAGDGFGYQPFFDACARDDSLENYICGFSFDLSEGREEPGVYLLPPVEHANADYVPAMLERLGAKDRVPKVMEVFHSLPPGWTPYYAGYMASRPNAPTRLGIVIQPSCMDRYAKDPGQCEADLRKFYPVPFSEGTREMFSFLLPRNCTLDIQFDLYPDGSFVDGLGVTISGVSADPRHSRGALGKGNVGEIMRYIEARGLADERWKLMDQTCFGIAKRVYEDGVLRLAGDVVKLNAVKIRFKKGEAFLAKGYLMMKSSNL